MHGRPNRRNKATFSNLSGTMWTGRKVFVLELLLKSFLTGTGPQWYTEKNMFVFYFFVNFSIFGLQLDIMQGDVQMCVSALIVLGDKIRHKIDEQIQEQWLMSYIGKYSDLK